MSDKFGVCMICRFCRLTEVKEEVCEIIDTWHGDELYKHTASKTGHKCIIKDKIIDEDFIPLVRLCEDFERQK